MMMGVDKLLAARAAQGRLAPISRFVGMSSSVVSVAITAHYRRPAR
jgi:hypothetical protein